MEPRKHKVEIPGGATLENLIMGHNVALAGGGRVTKKQLFHLPSPGAGPVMEIIHTQWNTLL